MKAARTEKEVRSGVYILIREGYESVMESSLQTTMGDDETPETPPGV